MFEKLPPDNNESTNELAELACIWLAQKSEQLPAVMTSQKQAQPWSVHIGQVYFKGVRHRAGILRIQDTPPLYLFGLYPCAEDVDAPTSRTLLRLGPTSDILYYPQEQKEDLLPKFLSEGEVVSAIVDIEPERDAVAPFIAMDLSDEASRLGMLAKTL